MPQRLPDLTFPSVSYGTHETPHSLQVLMYSGATALRINIALRQIRESRLGNPLNERLPLVLKLHEFLQGKLAAGGSKDSLHNTFRALCRFTAWCELNNRPITIAASAQNYLSWTDHLHHRYAVRKEISFKSAYQDAERVDLALSDVLNLELGLQRHSKLHAKRGDGATSWAKQERPNPEETFESGHMLLDVCDALDVASIYGSLPVTIPFRNGSTWVEWSGLARPDKVPSLSGPRTSYTTLAEETRRNYADNHSFATRHPLINLRIEAEMLIFISQTGLNLAQATKLKRDRFRYRRDGDEYRVYKSRRGGEVEFKIYREYRPLFERYLKWLEDQGLASNDARLFPFIHKGIIPAAGARTRFTALRSRFLRHGFTFYGPLALRNVRVNWVIRQTGNAALTAEMHQHTVGTLLRHYESPNHQIAVREITRFHELTDPALSPPGPGLCIGEGEAPKKMAEFDAQAPKPDCISPAGCLFCWYHRDELSDDYVWSLASYRHLKTIELSLYVPPNDPPKHPAQAVIERLTAKLEAIGSVNSLALAWVTEAHSRVREEHYHPAWDGFIQCVEP